MRIRGAHIALFALAMIFAGLLVVPKPKEMALWEAQAGNIYKTIARFEKASEQRPRDRSLRRALAFYLCEVTSFDQAFDVLSYEVEKEYDLPETHRIYGQIQERQTNLKAAKDHYKKSVLAALADDDTAINIDAFNEAINHLKWNKDFEGLIAVISAALKRGIPVDMQARSILSWAHESLGQFELAIEQRLLIARHLKTDVGTWNHLVDLYELSGQLEKELDIRSMWRELGDWEMGLEFARRLADLKRFDEQEEILVRVSNRFPGEFYVAQDLIAFAFLHGGDKVDKHLKIHLKRWPEDIAAMSDYAFWLRAGGRQEEAEILFKQALGAIAHDAEPDMLLRKAAIYDALDRSEDAMALYESLQDVRPVEAGVALVELYSRRGMNQKALVLGEQLISQYKDRDVFAAYANVLSSLGQYQKALDQWVFIYRTYGPDVNVVIGLVGHNIDLGRLDEAQRWVDKFADLKLEPIEMARLKSRILYESDKTEEAFALLDKWAQNDKSLDHQGFSFQYVSLALQLNHQKAEHLANGHIKRWPSDFYLRQAYGNWLLSKGIEDEGRKMLEDILNDLPADAGPDLLLLKASTLALLKRDQEAIILYEELESSRPYQAGFALIDLYSRTGLRQKALNKCRKLVDSYDNRSLRVLLATLLYEQGFLSESRSQWETLFETYGVQSDVMVGLIDINLQMQDLDQVEKWLSRFEGKVDEVEFARLKARYLFETDRPRQALALLDKTASQTNAFDYQAFSSYYIVVGLELGHPGVHERIEAHFEKWPNDLDAKINYGSWLFFQGRTKEGRTHLLEALGVLQDRLDPASRLSRASIHSVLGNLETAVALYEGLLDDYPWQARRGLVDLYGRQGRHARALEISQELLSERKDRDLYIAVALLYSDLGKRQKAYEFLTQAHALREDANVLSLLATNQLDQGKMPEALSWIEKLKARAPDHRNARWLQIRYWIAMGKRTEALAAMQELMKDPLYSNDLELHRLLTVTALNQGDQRADEYATQFLKQWGHDVDVHLAYGNYLRSKGKIEEAEKQFLLALDALPEDTTLIVDQFRRADVLASLGRFGEAIAFFESRLEEDPVAARLRLSFLYRQAGYISKWEKIVEELNGLDSSDETKLAWAEVLVLRGQLKSAKEVWHGILKTNPRQIDALVALAGAYIDEGRFDEADELLKDFKDGGDWRIDLLYARKDYALGDYRGAFLKLENMEKEGLLTQRLDAWRLWVSWSLARDVEGAEQRALAFLSVWPNDVEGLADFGSWLLTKKRDIEAEQYFQRALSVLRNDRPGTLQEARILILVKRGEQALAILQELESETPYAAKRLMIEAHLSMGHDALALDVAEEVYKSWPNRETKKQYAQMLHQSSHNDSAILEYEEFLKEYGPDLDVMVGVVYAWQENNKPNEAKIAFDRLLEHYPEASQTRRLRAGFLAAEGKIEEALAVLEELYQEDSIAPDDSLWPETLMATGNWHRGLKAWDILSVTEPPLEWKWWNRRDAREIHEDQYNLLYEFTDGPGAQKMRHFEHWVSMFHTEAWRMEYGESYTAWDNNDDPNRFHDRSWGHWLQSDYRHNVDVTSRARFELDRLDHVTRPGYELGLKNHHPAYQWDVSWSYRSTKGVQELQRLDGRENRWSLELSQPARELPIGFVEGYEIWDYKVDLHRNRQTRRRYLGKGRRWFIGADVPLTILEYSNMPNFVFSWRFTRSKFKPTSQEVFDLVPLTRSEQSHGFGFNMFHRWDRAWEWTSNLGWSDDAGRSTQGWTFGTGFRYRTPDAWRFGAGYDFASEAAAVRGTNVRRWYFDCQYLF